MSIPQPQSATRQPDRSSSGIAEFRQQHNADKRRSKYRGLSWRPKDNAWNVTVCLGNNKMKYCGRHKDEIEAARLYDRKAVELLGDRAKLNFPGGRTDVLAAARPEAGPEPKVQVKPRALPPIDPTALAACWTEHPTWTVQDIAHEYEARTGNRIRSSEAWTAKPVSPVNPEAIDPAPPRVEQAEVIPETPPEAKPQLMPTDNATVSATQEWRAAPPITIPILPARPDVIPAALSPIDPSPDDPEVAAMALVVRALSMLDGPGRGRVLGYAVARFGKS